MLHAVSERIFIFYGVMPGNVFVKTIESDRKRKLTKDDIKRAYGIIPPNS